MTSIILDDNKLKGALKQVIREALKQAIRELIQEDQAMISNLVAEVVEDVVLENLLQAVALSNFHRETETSLKLNVTLKKPSQQQALQALDEFDQAVKQFLEETDITKEELAEALDLSQPLSKWA
ncbi:hypothetical protein PCC9214_04986 [Planktothrix tepida]|uniref:Uncharacterized protein n=2 Tax=Planktothrix TaxID=54304 RepID=A0A1J1LVS8_9CYAN|nr:MULTISPECIES: hypothetical protein [Planktothrix]CAD5917500.1 hypothetical protein NO713_00443 [Planktothrix pseudagardhii]CAD5982480.1 hypothetical protein PCC9214_04986 [Planktothrix tepida]CUR35801.1 hypothetical protein PL9214720071 [Planktothrix tepida PCC 9214]